MLSMESAVCGPRTVRGCSLRRGAGSYSTPVRHIHEFLTRILAGAHIVILPHVARWLHMSRKKLLPEATFAVQSRLLYAMYVPKFDLAEVLPPKATLMDTLLSGEK